MSRSRKKEPVFKDYSRSTSKYVKRCASKAVRKYKGIISDGCFYQKIFPSYEIHDWKFRIEKSNEYWYKKSLRK